VEDGKAPPTALLGRADFSAWISGRLIRRKSIQIMGSPKKRSFYGATAEAEDKMCPALEMLQWFLGPNINMDKNPRHMSEDFLRFIKVGTITDVFSIDDSYGTEGKSPLPDGEK